MKRLVTKTKSFSERRPSDDKLIVAWYEKQDYTVGIQGTSEWYGCKNIDEAEKMINKLMRG